MNRIIRLKEVCWMTGLSPATVYRYMAKGVFPASIALGEKMVGWNAATVQAWVDDRLKESEQPTWANLGETKEEAA